MEIYSFIFYLISMLISAYYTVMLIGVVVKRKYKRYWYTIIYAILNLIHVYLADFVFESLKFKYANFYIVNWLLIYLLYKGTTLKKMLAYMEMVSAVLFTELIGTQVLLAMEENKEEFITIKTKEGFYTIDVNKITSIESRGRYLRINTEDVEELNVIMTMNEIEDKVNEKLIKCHRSYFINIEKVRKIAKYEVTLVNKEVVPVSRPNYKLIYDEYMKYLTR